MKIKALDMPDKIFGIDSAMISTLTPLVAVLILAILGTNLIILPKFDSFQVANKSGEDLTASNNDLLEKLRYIQSVDPNELKTNADFIANALLPQKNAYLLVDIVRKIADKHNFQVDSFLVSPGKLDKPGVTATTVKANTTPKIPIQVSLVGSKDSYLELINGLEKSLPILTLNGFKMTTQGTLVKLDLQISASYIQDSAKFDINKLTLADLTLKKEETDLIATLNQFTILEDMGSLESQTNTQAEFKKYDRTDPFSP
jgi:hypothetical protein